MKTKKVSVHIISGEETHNLTMQRCLCCVSPLPLKSRSIALLFSFQILAIVTQKSFPLIWPCLFHFLSAAVEKGSGQYSIWSCGNESQVALLQHRGLKPKSSEISSAVNAKLPRGSIDPTDPLVISGAKEH